MLKCKHCGSVIEEDDLMENSSTIYSHCNHIMDEKDTCPYCNGDTFKEVYSCKICGEYSANQYYCNKCLKEKAIEYSADIKMLERFCGNDITLFNEVKNSSQEELIDFMLSNDLEEFIKEVSENE